MRFLWVEDFNEDKGDRAALEARWKEYFGLDEVIVREDLKSALEYLDDREHFADFDGVLLDIRFPSGGGEIYRQYFSGIITEKLYRDYEEGGTGILLYLALALRYSYNQERIAFISGNVDEGEAMRPLTAMMNILIKSRNNQALSDADRDEYTSQEELLAEFYLENVLGLPVPRMADGTIDWEAAGSWLWTAFEEEKGPEPVIGMLEAVRDQIRSWSGKQSGTGSLKYSSVCRQFNECGLILPRAFEKPFREKDEKSWSFYEWKRDIGTPYYVVRSGIIEMCRILQKQLAAESGNQAGAGLTAPFWRRAQLRHCRDIWRQLRDEDGSAGQSQDQFIWARRAAWDRGMGELLDGIPDMLPAMSASAGDDTLAAQAEGCVREILRYVDGMGNFGPEPGSRDLDACCLTMKLARNWTSHQGIRNMAVGDCGFLLALCLRGYFDISRLTAAGRAAYLAREEEVLKLLGPGDFAPDQAALGRMLDESFSLLLAKNRAAYKAGNSREDTPIFKIISGIGHENSKCRETVSMDEIYLLFWQLMFGGTPPAPGTELDNFVRYSAGPAWRAAEKLAADS